MNAKMSVLLTLFYSVLLSLSFYIPVCHFLSFSILFHSILICIVPFHCILFYYFVPFYAFIFSMISLKNVCCKPLKIL